MIRQCLIATALWIGVSLPALAAEPIEKISPHSVEATVDRLVAAIEGTGATVIARVNHSAAAHAAEMDLRPTQVLIFGNPELGTPAMQDSQTAGLDLPLRVLAYEDADGRVHVAYHRPAELAATHGLPEDAEYIVKMTSALEKLTAMAIASD